MNATVVHINGWPGCGKLTIGRALRDRIGACLVHNHLFPHRASALFERGTKARAALRGRLRDMLCKAARDLPADRPIIVTDALAETDRHGALFDKTVRLAEATSRTLRAVVLDISADENIRRLTSPARAGISKLRDPVVLRDLRARHELMHLLGALKLDVTQMPAATAADGIAEWLKRSDA